LRFSRLQFLTLGAEEQKSLLKPKFAIFRPVAFAPLWGKSEDEGEITYPSIFVSK